MLTCSSCGALDKPVGKPSIFSKNQSSKGARARCQRCVAASAAPSAPPRATPLPPPTTPTTPRPWPSAAPKPPPQRAGAAPPPARGSTSAPAVPPAPPAPPQRAVEPQTPPRAPTPTSAPAHLRRAPVPPLPPGSAPLSASVTAREEGNKLYGRAVQTGLARVLAVSRLAEAVAKYRSAFLIAARHGDGLTALAPAAKNVGVSISKLLALRTVAEHGGLTAFARLAAEAIHAFVIAYGARAECDPDAAWLAHVETSAAEVAVRSALTLNTAAADLDEAARATQLFADIVSRDSVSAAALPYWADLLLCEAADGVRSFGVQSILARIAAVLHMRAARYLLGSVVAFTEEAGAISNMAVAEARERAGERSAARAAFRESRRDARLAAGEDIEEEEEGEGEDDVADEDAAEREVHRRRTSTLQETLDAEAKALQRGLPILGEAAPHLARAERFNALTGREESEEMEGGGSYGYEESEEDADPIDAQLSKLLPAHACPDDEIEELVSSFDTQRAALESRKLRLQATALLEFALHGDDVLNVSLVHDALDSFKAAAMSSRDKDIENEAMCCAAMGVIHGKILFTHGNEPEHESKAYSYCFTAVSLAAALAPRSVVSHEWYQESRSYMQTVRDKRERIAKAAVKAEEGDLLKGREKECAAIDAAAEKGVAHLLTHIYAHHPPIRKGAPITLIPQAVFGDFIVATLNKSVVLYHPDVPANKICSRENAMCAFICARLTAAKGLISC